MTVFHGTKHNDTFNESSDTSSDTFDLYKDGNDTAIGGSGDDQFNMGASLNASDRLDGGAGTDKLFLHGDYSAGVVFDDQTIQNIEVLRLGAGFSYNLTLADGNVAAGETLTVNARALGAGHHLTFDGSAELDGSFTVYDSAGNDTITGGAQADKFNLSKGGNDIVHGGGGNDVFNLGTALTASDSINGGSGGDTVHLYGNAQSDVVVTATATTLTSIETIDFGTGSYALTTADAMVDAGTTMQVNVRGSSTVLTFNTAAETDGFFAIDSNATENFITFGSAAVLAGSTFTGTGTNNALLLNGDFSAGVTLNASQLADFQTLNVLAGHDYNLTTTADAVNANGFEVFADALGAGNSLTFDGSAQTTASFTIFDGAGDDNITTGGGGDDIFVSGGTDIVHAGGGDDVIFTGLTFNVSDQFDGGTGYDNVSISSGGTFVFNATTIQNIEELDLSFGSYTITTNDANVASGAVLKVDASQLTAAQVLTFNGGAETDGFFSIDGGAGNDVINMGAAMRASENIDGGGGNDTLNIAGDYSSGFTFAASTMVNVENLGLGGGHDYKLTTNDATVASGSALTVNMVALGTGHTLTLDGTAETDGFLIVTAGAAFTAADSFIGGSHGNLLILNGDYSGGLTFGATTIEHVGEIELGDAGGSSYKLTTNDANVDTGATLTVDASALTTGALTFNGAAETNGQFAITGGAGADTITGGSKGDTFTGGSGVDIFAYTAAGQSTSINYDKITDFAAGIDKIDTTITVSSFFTTTINHSVSATTFDSDLGSAGDDALPGHQAWIVHANAGDLMGHDFLVVDVNGNAQYNAGTDYVIDITGYTGTITAGDFI